MRVCFLCSVILYLAVGAVKAQTPAQLLQRAIDSASGRRSVSYLTITISKNMFSDKDTTIVQGKEDITRDNSGKILAQNIANNFNDVQMRLRDVFL